MTEKERDQILLDMHKDMSVLKTDVGALKIDVENLKKETADISRSVALIENEHGEKLQILLDVYSDYPKKFESINNHFKSHEKKFDNHSARIIRLESKIGIN